MVVDENPEALSSNPNRQICVRWEDTMTPEGEKWVARVHKKRGFPPTPAWPDQAEHYISAFVAEVEKRAKALMPETQTDGNWEFYAWDAIEELTRELLGGTQ